MGIYIYILYHYNSKGFRLFGYVKSCCKSLSSSVGPTLSLLEPQGLLPAQRREEHNIKDATKLGQGHGQEGYVSRMDIGFYMEILLWPLLVSLYWA